MSVMYPNQPDNPKIIKMLKTKKGNLKIKRSNKKGNRNLILLPWSC